MTRRILQIMPALGWAAVLGEGRQETYLPLMGWALVEDAQRATQVVGLLARAQVELCDEVAEFHGYAFVEEMGDLDEAVFDQELGDDFYDLDEDDDEGPQRPKPRLN